MSTLKTGLLMIALTALLMLIGSFFGEGGIIIAFVFAVIMNFGSYWFSDKIVLSMYKAQEVGSSHELYQIVQQQTQRSGLPMPRVYVIPNESPNAFATGRNPKHAAVAATQGIMRILSREELAGVIAHELAHIKNRDILICSIVATMAGAIMMVASMAQWAAIFGGFHSDDDEDSGGIISLLFMIIVAPLAATIIQLAISRSREYAADRGGAEICGNPLWLSNALRKLERGVAVQPMRANEATSHLFIVNPLRGGFSRLFSTHPPMEERIRLLEGMSGSRRMI
ncbi:zinc metalloprotease HtpX [Candidatus Poribacteria bacterium]|nr:zinc metalloprotease HtpX [Candidatus Poribacteria bacterium]